MMMTKLFPNSIYDDLFYHNMNIDRLGFSTACICIDVGTQKPIE